MNMFGHDDIPDHAEAVAQPRRFQGTLEGCLGSGLIEPGLPLIAAEGEEVQILGVLVSTES